MNEILKPVGVWISQNVPWTVLIVVFIFCLFFDISKVKIYPIRWMWKMICWPFKKINEKRANSMKNLFLDLKKDLETQLTSLTESTSANCKQLQIRFDNLEKRFDSLDTQQVETEERLDRLAAARIKNHVLNFARQCRKGEPHSHEDFANLFKENQEYQVLVKKYGWENDVYTHDYAYIQRVYDGHNDNAEFIE